MIIRFKNIVYIFIVTLVILLIIKNWGFITDIYKYNIYKENCIITKINDQKNYPIKISEELAEKFCDCKIKNFKKENVEIFVSKLRVEKKFVTKDKMINKKCKKKWFKIQ